MRRRYNWATLSGRKVAVGEPWPRKLKPELVPPFVINHKIRMPAPHPAPYRLTLGCQILLGLESGPNAFLDPNWSLVLAVGRGP